MKFRAMGVLPPSHFYAWKKRTGFTPEEIALAKKSWRTIRELLNPTTSGTVRIRAQDDTWLPAVLRVLDTEYRVATRNFRKRLPPGEPLRYLLAKIAYLHGLLPEDWETNLNEYMPRIKRTP